MFYPEIRIKRTYSRIKVRIYLDIQRCRSLIAEFRNLSLFCMFDGVTPAVFWWESSDLGIGVDIIVFNSRVSIKNQIFYFILMLSVYFYIQ